MIIDIPWMPRLVPVASLGGAVASSTAEVTAGSDNAKFVTPAALAGSNPVFAAGTVPDQIAATINPRAPAQGLVFNGTAGATVSGIPAFGTGDFTVRWKSRITTPAVNAYILGGVTNCFGIAIEATTGNLYVEKGAASSVALGVAITSGKSEEYTYSRTGTTGKVYKKGVLVATVTDAQNYTVATTVIGATGGGDTFILTGEVQAVSFYNRILTAAEVLALYERGAPPAADFNNASNTVAYTSNFSAGEDSWYGQNGTAAGNIDSIGSQNDNLRLTMSGGSAFHQFTRLVLPGYNAAKYTRLLVDVYNPSASAAITRIGITSGGAEIAGTATKDAWTTVSADFITSDIYPRITVNGGSAVSADGQVVYIRNVRCYAIGLLLAPEGNAPGNGYQWKDMSGNKADITLPVSGVAWVLPDRRPNSVRGTIAWAAAHGPTTLGVIPANAVIDDIVSTATAGSSGSGMTVGSVTTPALLVAANVFTTAKKVHTLAARLPAGSATNDLTLVVDPDTANFTGSIETEVFYKLAQ